MILKRIVVFRMLFYGTVILGGLSIIENKKELDVSMTVTPTYFKRHRVPEGSRLTLVSPANTKRAEW